MTEWKMDAEKKAKWLEALRSGDYRQGRACLRNTQDEYCCLGVYLEAVEGAKYTGVSESNSAQTGDFYTYDMPNGNSCGDLFSFSATIPITLIPDPVQWSLINLNDYEKLTFREIANYVETNF